MLFRNINYIDKQKC